VYSSLTATLLAFELSQKLQLQIRLTTKCSSKGAVLNLVDEHVAGPAIFPAAPNVELSLLIVPASFQVGDVVGPANFSHKLCEFFIRPISFIKVLHAPQVGGREAVQAREVFSKIVRQISDHGFVPGVPALPIHDHAADIEIETQVDDWHRAVRNYLFVAPKVRKNRFECSATAVLSLETWCREYCSVSWLSAVRK
jgi:hypothetical protein